MDTPQPLRIHISNTQPDLILFNGKRLGRLTHFELHAGLKQPLTTTYSCIGCFPDFEDAPFYSLSNKEYPLWISAAHDTDSVVVVYKNKPIGLLQEVHVKLNAEQKRQISLTTSVPLPKELEQALLDLGLEIIHEVR